MDLIFHNGLVLLGAAPNSPPASAVGVQGDQIVAVGNDEVLAAATTSTRVVDLDGRTLLPGVNDGHLHIGGFASSRPPASLDISPAAVATIAEIVALVAERAQTVPAGSWIRGRGWTASHLSDLPTVEPSAALLDAVSPHHPVVLTDFSGHALWVNTAAMQFAGVSAATTEPVGGIMRRDASREPTGIFVESAQNLITAHIPVLTDDELEEAVRSGLAELHRQGITSMTDAALNPLPGNEDHMGSARVFELLRKLCGPDDVPMRTNVLVTFSPLGSTLLDPTRVGLDAWQPPDADPAWFNVRGLKVFADGVPPNCTSWMHDQYPDGGHGCLTVGGDTDADRVDELGEIIATGHRAGLQVGVHVTGDRASEAVVDGFLAALDAVPRDDPRHYIIHGPLTMPETLARASAAGIGVNVQPTLKSTSARAIEAMFGREMSDYQWPLRSILDAGCVMAASSDAPVTTPNWRRGIGTALLREAPDGEVYGADQRIGVDEAVRAYTAGGAWQDNAETWKGTIANGMVADLCVVDGRLSTDDPHTFADMDVSMTVVGGAVVHDTNGS